MQAALDKVNEEKDILAVKIQQVETERDDLQHTQGVLHEQIDHVRKWYHFKFDTSSYRGTEVVYELLR